MVMDLNPPDLSGYELLQQMTEQDGVPSRPSSYTGRALSRDEEQQLRRSPSSSRTARPSGCWTKSRCSCTRWSRNLSAEHRQMLQVARNRERPLEGRNVLVVEDDVQRVCALQHPEPTGIRGEIARNGLRPAGAGTRSSNSGASPPSTWC